METQGHAILVIDDDPDLRALLIDLLHGEEMTVVAVASAEEGLAQLPYLSFDVAFVDHHLPRMDGLTLCGYLRRANPLVEVVLITGEDSPHLRNAAAEEGVRFLEKPLDLDRVLKIIDQHRKDLLAREEIAEDPYWAPRFEPWPEDLPSGTSLPAAPARMHDALLREIKGALSRLRSGTRYTERDRVLALSGLLSARLLGLSLPLLADGRSMTEEYDRIMLRLGKRPEFERQD